MLSVQRRQIKWQTSQKIRLSNGSAASRLLTRRLSLRSSKKRGVSAALRGGSSGGAALLRLKKRTRSTLSSKRLTPPRRLRSLRKSAQSRAWAWRKPRRSSKALRRPSKKASTKTNLRNWLRSSRTRVRKLKSSNRFDYSTVIFAESPRCRIKSASAAVRFFRLKISRSVITGISSF